MYTMHCTLQAAGSKPADAVAKSLVQKAVQMGSTDDVTVTVMRLGSA